MIKKLLCLVIMGFVAGCTLLAGDKHPQLKAFPPAVEGMERLVIVLPSKDRDVEGDFKVEVIPGKTMMTDGVNQYRLGLSVAAKPLKGWGYTYYQVNGPDLAMTTKMAPRQGLPGIEAFVKGKSLLIPYNSRLPIVIYVPQGCEVRYKIWSASEKMPAAEKG